MPNLSKENVVKPCISVSLPHYNPRAMAAASTRPSPSAASSSAVTLDDGGTLHAARRSAVLVSIGAMTDATQLDYTTREIAAQPTRVSTDVRSVTAFVGGTCQPGEVSTDVGSVSASLVHGRSLMVLPGTIHCHRVTISTCMAGRRHGHSGRVLM